MIVSSHQKKALTFMTKREEEGNMTAQTKICGLKKSMRLAK